MHTDALPASHPKSFGALPGELASQTAHDNPPSQYGEPDGQPSLAIRLPPYLYVPVVASAVAAKQNSHRVDSLLAPGSMHVGALLASTVQPRSGVGAAFAEFAVMQPTQLQVLLDEPELSHTEVPVQLIESPLSST